MNFSTNINSQIIGYGNLINASNSLIDNSIKMNTSMINNSNSNFINGNIYGNFIGGNVDNSININSSFGDWAVDQVATSHYLSSANTNNNYTNYGSNHITHAPEEAYLHSQTADNTQELQHKGEQIHNHYYGDTIIGDGNIQGDNLNIGNGNDFSTNVWGRETFRFTEDADTLTILGDGRDRITNFDPEADTIYLDADELMDGNLSDSTVYIANSRRDVRWYAERAHELIYFENKGKLLYDGNGSQSGLGDGGTVAKLAGSPELYSDSIQLV